MAQKIGQLACQILPAFHALTGCENTSSLDKFGNVRAWTLLQRSIDEFKALATFGTTLKPNMEETGAATPFISKLYGGTDQHYGCITTSSLLQETSCK